MEEQNNIPEEKVIKDNDDNGVVYATFTQRALAILIDTAVLLPLIFILNIGFSGYLSSKVDLSQIVKDEYVTTEQSANINEISSSSKNVDNNIITSDKDAQKITYNQIDKDKLVKEAQDYILIYQLIILFVFIGYVVFSHKKYGNTVGAKVMKIMLVASNQDELRTGKIIHRSILAIFSLIFYGVGFLPILFTKEKLALHDILANTRVVSLKK